MVYRVKEKTNLVGNVYEFDMEPIIIKNKIS
jgi:hypothetical protein